VDSRRREKALYVKRNYLAGGGRGEKAGSAKNGSELHILRTTGIETLTISARKDQNGIKKRKSRPTRG
jgi:hypothetical protein